MGRRRLSRIFRSRRGMSCRMAAAGGRPARCARSRVRAGNRGRRPRSDCAGVQRIQERHVSKDVDQAVPFDRIDGDRLAQLAAQASAARGRFDDRARARRPASRAREFRARRARVARTRLHARDDRVRPAAAERAAVAAGTGPARRRPERPRSRSGTEGPRLEDHAERSADPVGAHRAIPAACRADGVRPEGLGEAAGLYADADRQLQVSARVRPVSGRRARSADGTARAVGAKAGSVRSVEPEPDAAARDAERPGHAAQSRLRRDNTDEFFQKYADNTDLPRAPVPRYRCPRRGRR